MAKVSTYKKTVYVMYALIVISFLLYDLGFISSYNLCDHYGKHSSKFKSFIIPFIILPLLGLLVCWVNGIKKKDWVLLYFGVPIVYFIVMAFPIKKYIKVKIVDNSRVTVTRSIVKNIDTITNRGGIRRGGGGSSFLVKYIVKKNNEMHKVKVDGGGKAGFLHLRDTILAMYANECEYIDEILIAYPTKEVLNYFKSDRTYKNKIALDKDLEKLGVLEREVLEKDSKGDIILKVLVIIVISWLVIKIYQEKKQREKKFKR